MKKTTLLFVLLISTLNVFSARYLVQPSGSGSSWINTADATVVNLTTEGVSLNDWLRSKSFSANDEIWVIKGTYQVNSTWSPAVNVKIYGGFDGTESTINDRNVGADLWDYTNETVLDGSSFPSTATTGVIDTNSKNITIDGFTFTSVPLNSTFVIRQRPNSIIQNCRFIQNSTIVISYYETATVTNPGIVNNCYFYQNSAAANASNHSQGTCITATGGPAGSPRFNVSNCFFEENDNTSNIDQASGVVRVQGATSIEKSVFKNNKITTTKIGSSAITLMNGECNLINCLIFGSTGKSALYVHNGGIITNCTFANNPGQGAYIYPNAGSSTLIFTNTVFWGNTNNDAYIFFSGGTATKATFANCATRGISNSQTNTTNHITLSDSNPNFINPSTNDYSLATGSVLIDKGTSTGAPAVDLMGMARPKGAGVDIGAFEFDPTTTQIANINADDFRAYNIEGGVVIECLERDEIINIFSLSGMLLKTEKLHKGINKVHLPSNKLYIIQSNKSTIKTWVK